MPRGHGPAVELGNPLRNPNRALPGQLFEFRRQGPLDFTPGWDFAPRACSGRERERRGVPRKVERAFGGGGGRRRRRRGHAASGRQAAGGYERRARRGRAQGGTGNVLPERYKTAISDDVERAEESEMQERPESSGLPEPPSGHSFGIIIYSFE